MKRGRKPTCPYCGSTETARKGNRRTATLGDRPLVLCRYSIDGYSFFNMIRASSVLNRQLTFAPEALRATSQALTSRRMSSVLSIRRERH